MVAKPSLPPILSLPPELLQHIVIASATGSPPSIITAITRTCKSFYSLVYSNSTDHHLWREIFLAVFDDPRPALKRLTAIHGEQPAFEWEEEFKSRMRAAQVVHRSNQLSRATNSAVHRPATRSVTAQMSLKRSSETEITLRTILSVLATSLPFLSTTTIAFGSFSSSSPGTPKYPAFPPLVLLLSSPLYGAFNKGHFLHVLQSTSSEWLQDVLSHGFPRALTRRLLADPSLLDVRRGNNGTAEGGVLFDIPVEQESRDWGMSEEARLFHKLVAYTGFIPASASAQCVEARQKSDLVQDDEDTYFTPNISLTLSDADDPLVTLTPSAAERQDPSADAQFASARKMARRTVYDLRYLRPDRMFGPFMPQSADENIGRQEGSSRRSRSDDDDDSDSHYIFNGTDSDSNSTTEDEAANEEYDLFPLINLITPQDMDSVPTNFEPPSLDALMPDWAWLAAARIVVEANLRDMLRRSPTVDIGAGDTESGLEEVANALRRLEGLRMGGAPGFWDDGWMVWDKTPDRVDCKMDAKGKGKAVDMFEYEVRAEDGWDWAGVAGTWR
jgi:hypothetical protein